MQQNDVVLYIENEKTYNALVLSSKQAPDTHAGQALAKDTPIVEHLSLAFLFATSQLQAVGNLISVIPGLFLRVVHGVRPLESGAAQGWRPVAVVTDKDVHGSGVQATDDQVFAALKEQWNAGQRAFVPIGGATQEQFVAALNKLVTIYGEGPEKEPEGTKVGPDNEVPEHSDLPSAEELKEPVNEQTATLQPNHFIPSTSEKAEEIIEHGPAEETPAPPAEAVPEPQQPHDGRP
jgi:hypothetical protein